MFAALILATQLSGGVAHAHRPHNHAHHRSPRHHQRVWVVDVGGHGQWVLRSHVRWVPGHYVGNGQHRRWVPGKFVRRHNHPRNCRNH